MILTAKTFLRWRIFIIIIEMIIFLCILGLYGGALLSFLNTNGQSLMIIIFLLNKNIKLFFYQIFVMFMDAQQQQVQYHFALSRCHRLYFQIQTFVFVFTKFVFVLVNYSSHQVLWLSINLNMNSPGVPFRARRSLVAGRSWG